MEGRCKGKEREGKEGGTRVERGTGRWRVRSRPTTFARHRARYFRTSLVLGSGGKC